MNCQKAESMVGPYINKKLSGSDLEEFLDHVESCPDCYEELETNFIVQEAVHRMNDNADTDMDFQQLLRQDIQKSRRSILILRAERLGRIALFLLLSAVLARIVFLLIVEVQNLI